MAASARHFIAYFNLQFDPLIALTKLASSSTYTSLRPQKPTIVKCAFVEWCVRVSFKCSQLIASCLGIYALRSEFSVNFFTFNLSCMSQLFCGIYFHAIHIHTYIQTCVGNLEVLIFNFFFFFVIYFTLHYSQLTQPKNLHYHARMRRLLCNRRHYSRHIPIHTIS